MRAKACIPGQVATSHAERGSAVGSFAAGRRRWGTALSGDQCHREALEIISGWRLVRLIARKRVQSFSKVGPLRAAGVRPCDDCKIANGFGCRPAHQRWPDDRASSGAVGDTSRVSAKFVKGQAALRFPDLLTA